MPQLRLHSHAYESLTSAERDKISPNKITATIPPLAPLYLKGSVSTRILSRLADSPKMPLERQETGLSLSRLWGPGSKSSAPDGSGDDLILYRGNCHCGANRFEVHLPAITSAMGCDCSLCHKSGYLWLFPAADNIKHTRGVQDNLGTFETEALRHEVSC